MEQPTQPPVAEPASTPPTSRTSLVVPITVAVVGTALIVGGATAWFQQRSNQARISALETQLATLQTQDTQPSGEVVVDPAVPSETPATVAMPNQSKLLKSVPSSSINADPMPTNVKLYPEQIWLMPQQKTEYLQASRIKAVSPLPDLGRMFKAVDWNSEATSSNDGAIEGRKIALGFERTHGRGGRWGAIVLEYSTYDFAVGSEYYTYATEDDFIAVKNGQKANVIVNGVKGIATYELITNYDMNTIKKTVVFPFDSYYVAAVYDFKKPLPNSQTVIENLYNGVYPIEEEADLLLFDNLVNSLVFMDKQ